MSKFPDTSDPKGAGRIRRGLRGFFTDSRGVAAIEFALIVPFLFISYFLVVEVTLAIETRKKVDRMGSMIADLVTQQTNITSTDLKAIMGIADSMLQPYNRSAPVITTTAVQMTDEDSPKAQVVWSLRRLKDGTFEKGANVGAITDAPKELKTRGAFLVHVDTTLNYAPLILGPTGGNLVPGFTPPPFHSNYYLRPRQSTSIPCADDCKP